MNFRDIIARLDEFPADETIYAESATPTARAEVAAEREDATAPTTTPGLSYLLEVAAAREAIDVWQAWRPGQMPTLDDKLAAVIYYAQNDAWLPIE